MKKIIRYLVSTILVLGGISCTPKKQYDDAYSFDAEKHWNNSLYEANVRYNEEAHKFSMWEIVIAPTEETEGLERKTCEVCGFKLERSMSKLVHVHQYESTYSYDETYHFYASTCGHDIVKGKEEHKYGPSTIVKEATITEDGIKEKTCTVCGYKTQYTYPYTYDTPGEGFIIYSVEMLNQYSDSNIIKYKDYEILVDAGNTVDNDAVNKGLLYCCEDKYLDMIIISHAHSDHYGGLQHTHTYDGLTGIGRVIQNGETRNFIKSDLATYSALYNDASFEDVRDLVADPNKKIIQIDDEFAIEFLDGDYYYATSSGNNRSIGFVIRYRNTIAFFAGDAEGGAMSGFMNRNPNLTTEDDFVVFKALHHASNGTNSNAHLDYIKPDAVIVNAGLMMNGNVPRYNIHPYIDALTRIGNKTTDVYWAGVNGSFVMYCDGNKATVSGFGRHKEYTYQDSTGQRVFASIEDEKNVRLFESMWWKEAITTQGAKNFLGI